MAKYRIVKCRHGEADRLDVLDADDKIVGHYSDRATAAWDFGLSKTPPRTSVRITNAGMHLNLRRK